MTLKISIVIPTRNGAPYLRYCLETCLASDDRDLEVIVSDNNSTDGTQEMIAAFSDSRLHYYNTGANLSMRQNFEFALDKATGDYIIYIGDDDGVLKNGLATLRRVLEKYRPGVINWRHITYKWPHVEFQDSPSILKFRPQDFFGPLYKRDPRKILGEFCAGTRTSYRDGAHIYHGAVSRQLIDKTRGEIGGYFMAQSPDIYTGFSNLVYADNFIWIRNPVTIGGESPKSNGAAALKDTKHTQKQAQINDSFINLAGQDDIAPEIDLRARCLEGHIYANLIRVNKLHMNGEAKINHQKWREIILFAIDKLDPVLRRIQEEILYPFFAKADPSFIPPSLSPIKSIPDDIVEDVAPKANYERKTVNRPDLITVADTRKWIDTITEENYLPKRFLPLAFMIQARHAFRMRKKFRR